MKIKKKLLSMVSAIVLATSSISAFAACGDSTCATIGGVFSCIVELNVGFAICSEGSPCIIDC